MFNVQCVILDIEEYNKINHQVMFLKTTSAEIVLGNFSNIYRRIKFLGFCIYHVVIKETILYTFCILLEFLK